MAWNDPFETLVESIVDELGLYLQAKGTLAIHEVARIQEVCRDFCYTIKKDVHQATRGDYDAYLSRHSSTEQNRADYSSMLDNIHEFCNQDAALGALENDNRVQMPTNVRPRSKRDKVSTRQFDPNSDVMKEILALGAGKHRREPSISVSSSSDAFIVPPELNASANSIKAMNPAATSGKHVSVNSGLFFPDFGNAALQDSRDNTNNPAVATPHKPLSSIDAGVPVAANKKRPDSLSESLGKLDFSMADPFEDNNTRNSGLDFRSVNTGNQKATPHTPHSGISPVVDNNKPERKSAALSALFESVDDDDKDDLRIPLGNPQSQIADVSVKKISNSNTRSVENAYAQVAEASGLLRKPSGSGIKPAPNAADDNLRAKEENIRANDDNNRMRGVEGVKYNFSEDSLRKMCGSDEIAPKVENRENAVAPIDPKLVNGFRPYMFESIYPIDIPLPAPSDMKPGSISIVDRYVIPIALPGLLLGVALLLLTTVEVLVGVVFLGLAFIALLFSLPEIMPPDQRTPQATLGAIIGAKNARGVGRASSLLAVNKNGKDDEEYDFHELWEPLTPWPLALINRIRSPKLPDARLIAGSERQNSVLLLIPLEDDKTFTLLPLVRLNSKWYITDPKMTVREIQR